MLFRSATSNGGASIYTGGNDLILSPMRLIIDSDSIDFGSGRLDFSNAREIVGLYATFA